MKIVISFCADVRISRCCVLFNLGRTSMTDYYDNLRGCYFDQISEIPIRFNDTGIFEVDEMQLKHVRIGEDTYGTLWIQSIFERKSGKFVLIPVPKRNKRTLVGNIEKYIPQDSLICTDEWGAYNNINENGYSHRSVNHSKKEYSRIDIIDGKEITITINACEGIHRSIRQRFANKTNRKKERIDLILGEIMYRKSGRNLYTPFQFQK